MSILEIDALVRTNSLEMLGTDALPQRYITACNLISVLSKGMSPGFLRLHPEEIKEGKQQRDVLIDPSTIELDKKTEGVAP